MTTPCTPTTPTTPTTFNTVSTLTTVTARAALLALAVITNACTAQPAPVPPPAAAPAPAPLDTAMQRIDALVGAAACRADTDCTTVGIGWLACGGPQAWRAWSRTATDAKALDEAVAAHRTLRQQEITKRGSMSVCSLVADPGALCEKTAAAAAGQCRTRSDGRGSAATVR